MAQNHFSSFSVIGATRFGNLVSSDAAIRNVMLRYTELLWAEAQQLAACSAMHNGASRLARYLLQSADRIDTDELPLPLTQETLAQMLGMRRTTVTLLAQTFKEKGLIRYSRGHIVIVDREDLENEACECYSAVRDEQLALTIGILS